MTLRARLEQIARTHLVFGVGGTRERLDNFLDELLLECHLAPCRTPFACHGVGPCYLFRPLRLQDSSLFQPMPLRLDLALEDRRIGELQFIA